ncbi:unnamed protein product [Brassica rapa]|uniref:Uncharacterized protein n=1 Tax=Brassica campestris TaxID=3711 RepID=A0A8D9M360_BRACM|nr:unnamed protein product [Brassica rapa]
MKEDQRGGGSGGGWNTPEDGTRRWTETHLRRVWWRRLAVEAGDQKASAAEDKRVDGVQMVWLLLASELMVEKCVDSSDLEMTSRQGIICGGYGFVFYSGGRCMWPRDLSDGRLA